MRAALDLPWQMQQSRCPFVLKAVRRDRMGWVWLLRLTPRILRSPRASFLQLRQGHHSKETRRDWVNGNVKIKCGIEGQDQFIDCHPMDQVLAGLNFHPAEANRPGN